MNTSKLAHRIRKVFNFRFYKRHPKLRRKLRRHMRRTYYRAAFGRFWRFRYFFAWLRAFLTGSHMAIIPTAKAPTK